MKPDDPSSITEADAHRIRRRDAADLPREGLTLEERVERLERRVADLELVVAGRGEVP